VKAAVRDSEVVARRARTYNEANIRKRSAIEVEEAGVILSKARDERASIRKAHRAAIAVLETAQVTPPANDVAKGKGDGTGVKAAADQVERIGAILAAADLNVETIEQTFADLHDLEFPVVTDPRPGPGS
jgi:hypothetical protein